MIIVSPQSDAVASYGLDTHPDLLDFHINVEPFQAHTLNSNGEDYGYIQRIEALMSNSTYPLRSDGWGVGEACSDDGECISGLCSDRICKEVLGSCESCNDDSECASGKCYLSKCSRMDLMIDNGCTCVFDSDCSSGRCEGPFGWKCEAKKSTGESCNEDSDCESGDCSWLWGCK
mmetsp:Transcript_33400/g.44559  ORF Transcript_33400/g.44559 Transcript_33400/m.44559 type:complete len:175 (-) Transcript_33400:131-655(-)